MITLLSASLIPLFLMLLSASVLVALLKTIGNEELDLVPAVGIAIGTAIGSSLLATGLASLLGTLGHLMALALTFILLGIGLSAMLGIAIKRAFLIGFLYVTCYTVIEVVRHICHHMLFASM